MCNRLAVPIGVSMSSILMTVGGVMFISFGSECESTVTGKIKSASEVKRVMHETIVGPSRVDRATYHCDRAVGLSVNVVYEPPVFALQV